jgi:hypothetical protein
MESLKGKEKKQEYLREVQEKSRPSPGLLLMPSMLVEAAVPTQNHFCHTRGATVMPCAGPL